VWWLWTALLNAMIGAGGYWAARHAFHQPAGLPRGLAAATLAWAWVTVGVELLGSIGWLTLGALLAWALAGMTIGLAFRFRDSNQPGGSSRTEGVDWEPSATLALAVVFWAAALFGATSLLLPVKVVSDGPIYHLYFAVRWWKAGRLFLIPTPFGENAAPYFPAVGDLWFTWLTTCWGGDRLARVGQAPFLLMSALASYALARRLGIGAAAAVIATCWFVTCTPLFVFAFQPNVDTIFTAGYLAAAYFFLRFALKDGELAPLALGGLAAGGALGTKATGVVFVPPLLALASLAVVRREWNARRRLLGLAMILLAPLVMAGYWFAHNAWLTGNPLYPLHVEAFGRTWLAGWYGQEVMRKGRYYLSLRDWRAGIDILLAVFEPRLAPFWALALAGAWGLPAIRPRAQSQWVWACAGLVVLNLGLFWLLIPYRTQQRFMLHALGLATIPLACFFDRGRLFRVAGSLLLLLHAITPQPWPFAASEWDVIPWDLDRRIPNFIPGLVSLPISAEQRRATWSDPTSLNLALATVALGLGAVAVAWAWGRVFQRPAWNGRWWLATGFTASLVLCAGAVVHESSSEPRWLRVYPFFPDYDRGWLALERISSPSGSRIAYAGTNLPYYLMCQGLRNDVRYVNVNAHPSWLLDDYHRALGWPTATYPRPEWDRMKPDYEAWLANLKAARIELVVVAPANPAEGPSLVADSEGFPIERRWADEHPEVFTPVYGVVENDPLFRIYRLRLPKKS